MSVWRSRLSRSCVEKLQQWSKNLPANTVGSLFIRDPLVFSWARVLIGKFGSLFHAVLAPVPVTWWDEVRWWGRLIRARVSLQQPNPVRQLFPDRLRNQVPLTVNLKIWSDVLNTDGSVERGGVTKQSQSFDSCTWGNLEFEAKRLTWDVVMADVYQHPLPSDWIGVNHVWLIY